jgi:SAM-dependent methyltransferase
MCADGTASDATFYYQKRSTSLLERYEQVSFERVHADLLILLPKTPGHALDVGAGSGRDAAWLSRRGWDVVAAEPSSALREGALRIHAHERIRWINDSLPHLEETARMNRTFDLILLSAIWMHVPPSQEEPAIHTLAKLAKPGALLNITVRTGGSKAQRGFYATDIARLKRRAAKWGFEIISETANRDALRRSDVRWKSLIFKRNSVPFSPSRDE